MSEYKGIHHHNHVFEYDPYEGLVYFKNLEKRLEVLELRDDQIKETNSSIESVVRSVANLGERIQVLEIKESGSGDPDHVYARLDKSDLCILYQSLCGTISSNRVGSMDKPGRILLQRLIDFIKILNKKS